jgi:hypothetical protein
VGLGLARFGQPIRARVIWEEGREIAERHKLNEWYFRLERLLAHLDECAPELIAPNRAAMERPAELAQVAAGLRQYAASGD